MYSNQVYKLVEAPKKIKSIGCKQVYKMNIRVDEKVETFKAKLVVKGYSQKSDFDYKETFSSTVMLKYIKILLYEKLVCERRESNIHCDTSKL